MNTNKDRGIWNPQQFQGLREEGQEKSRWVRPLKFPHFLILNLFRISCFGFRILSVTSRSSPIPAEIGCLAENLRGRRHQFIEAAASAGDHGRVDFHFREGGVVDGLPAGG